MASDGSPPMVDATKHPEWLHALELFRVINVCINQLQKKAGLVVRAEDMIKVAALTVALAESGHHKRADFAALLEVAKELTDPIGRPGRTIPG